MVPAVRDLVGAVQAASRSFQSFERRTHARGNITQHDVVEVQQHPLAIALADVVRPEAGPADDAVRNRLHAVRGAAATTIMSA
jgi:hypothetical protein